MHILIVEDDARVADFLDRGLRAEGYRTQVARNGIDGLALARDVAQQTRKDGAAAVMLLDVMLPGMGGLEVCQTLRAAGVADSTPAGAHRLATPNGTPSRTKGGT